MNEEQFIELTVENSQNRLRIHALEQILALFLHHKTDKQQQALHGYYEYIRDQHLNNFYLDEDQAERLKQYLTRLKMFCRSRIVIK